MVDPCSVLPGHTWILLELLWMFLDAAELDIKESRLYNSTLDRTEKTRVAKTESEAMRWEMGSSIWGWRFSL